MKLAFEGQYQTFIKDGVTYRDIIGVSLLTAGPTAVKIQSGYITSLELVDSVVWNSLHTDGATPFVYFNGANDVTVNLNATKSSTMTINNDVYGGKLTVQGGTAADTFNLIAANGLTFVHGGDGDDTFNIGSGTLTALTKDVFIFGDAGTDKVEVWPRTRQARMSRSTVKRFSIP